MFFFDVLKVCVFSSARCACANERFPGSRFAVASSSSNERHCNPEGWRRNSADFTFHKLNNSEIRCANVITHVFNRRSLTKWNLIQFMCR